MKGVPTTCIALGLIAATHACNTSAQARGESVQSIIARTHEDPESVLAAKRLDLESWLPRLLGRWQFEDITEGTYRVDCSAVGQGSGVECVSRNVRPNPSMELPPPDAPDFTLYGLDPDLPGIRRLRISGLSIADHDEVGRLSGNTVNIVSTCPLPPNKPPSGPNYITRTPIRCEHQIRIFAPPGDNRILYTVRTDMMYLIRPPPPARSYFATLTSNAHSEWQRIPDGEPVEQVLQLESMELESLEHYGKPDIPELVGHIVDQADRLTPEQRADLESQLAAYEASTAQRIIIATAGNLNGVSIDTFAKLAAATWQLGSEDRAAYILVVAAPNDGAARIETGEAMRACVPDEMAQRILSESMIPDFQYQRFAEGLQKGVTRLMTACAGVQTEATPP